MNITWSRAKEWIVSLDEQYELKKQQRNRLIKLSEQHRDWMLGFMDEVWWSRLRDPRMHPWADDGGPLHWVEKTVDTSEADPKAIVDTCQASQH